jgi:hypothetical protein
MLRKQCAHLDELLPVDGVGLRAHGGVERPKGRPSDLWGEGRGERGEGSVVSTRMQRGVMRVGLASEDRLKRAVEERRAIRGNQGH